MIGIFFEEGAQRLEGSCALAQPHICPSVTVFGLTRFLTSTLGRCLVDPECAPPVPARLGDLGVEQKRAYGRIACGNSIGSVTDGSRCLPVTRDRLGHCQVPFLVGRGKLRQGDLNPGHGFIPIAYRNRTVYQLTSTPIIPRLEGQSSRRRKVANTRQHLNRCPEISGSFEQCRPHFGGQFMGRRRCQPEQFSHP